MSIEFTPVQVNTEAICVDCPVCKRTMWNGSVCSHGQVPEPKEEVKSKPDKKEQR